MIKRILKTISLIVLLLVIVLVAGLSWALGTQSGLKQTLALAKKFAPGTLAWDEASGKLAGNLTISGLQYSEENGIDARVDSLDFAWTPSALLGLQLDVNQLHVDGIEIRLAEAVDEQEATASSGELPDISLPVGINLDDIVISDIAIYPPGQETPIEINQVSLAVQMEGSDVSLAKLDVLAPQGEVHLDGSISTRDDYPMDLSVNWQAEIDPAMPLQGEGTFVGSLAQLQIQHNVAGFAEADIQASVNNITASPAWDANVAASIPEPGAVSPLLTMAPRITLQSSGTLDDFSAQVNAELETTDTGPVTVAADVSGSTEALTINAVKANLSENGAELSATGQVDLATLNSDIKGQWKALGWPITTEPQFSSAVGSFDFTGTPDDYSANVTAEAGGEAIPQGQWNISLNGSTTAADQFEVIGKTLDGTITAAGSANWEAQPAWDVELSTAGINPGVQWEELPGSIDLVVSSNGQISDNGPVINAVIKQLSGNFRNQPLSGSGNVQVNGDSVTIENLTMTHGATQLDADGQVDDQIAMDFNLKSPDLQTLLPELEGAISVTGSVSGTKEAPMLKASGSAENVAIAGNSVDSLNFDIDGGLGDTTESTLTVDVSDIAAGGQTVSNLTLRAQGSPLDHELALSASTNQGDLSTELNGGYENDTWKGSLASLELANTLAGDWRLREPADLSANASKADLSSLCLDNDDKLGSLCATANWLAEGESTATLNISGLSPDLVAEYLPPELLLETRLNGDATARLRQNGEMNAQANFALEAGTLTLDTEASPVVIGLEQTTIDASWQGNDAKLALAAAFTDFGDVTVQGSLSDPAGEGRLAGSLDADFADLTLISVFAPQVQEISGALKSNLSVGGTLSAPIIKGELALRDFSAEIPETAMVIQDLQLAVNGNPDGTLLITGQSRSGDGQLSINGNFDPSTRALQLDIKGDSYQVANTAMMQAVVSPDLSIAMNDTGMDVSGGVTIPSAYINANGGNEGIKTVSASSDVVYVSEEGEQVETPPSQISLDVQVILGESVEVEAGDFRGRLEGDLRIEQTPELAPRGTGTINVVNGDYVIYGQQLDMERGRILFSGGPVDNPSLDMEVARTVQEYDVIAGARIKGTAQSPRLELYSEPSMPDASILSYILLGQPPGITGGSYTLGKYLTPDLYVSYGIGLFDAINTFNMRYKLTDKLALEAASGSGSSTDLIFTIEK